MNLVELATGVYGLIDPDPHYGRSNIGVVVEADGVTVFDTGATPPIGDQAKGVITDLIGDAGLPIRRVVLSTSRVAHTGGSNPFWSAAFFGSEPTSEALDAPPNPDAFARLLPEHADCYDDEFTNRPVTHTVSDPAWLTPAIQVWPLAGEAETNLVGYLTTPNVVFAGAVGSFRVTPLAYDANPAAWADSLDQLAALNPTVIPGHGSPGGVVDLADQAAYLRACVAAGRDGRPQIEPGPWDGWTDRRFDEVNIERAELIDKGRDEIPQSMFRLLGLG